MSASVNFLVISKRS